MEQTNFIGLVYSTLQEAGIDTEMMTVEEAIEKYNEIVNQEPEFEDYENVSVEEVANQVKETPEEIIDEPLEGIVEEAEKTENSVEEPLEEPADETELEETTEETEVLDDDTLAQAIAEHKDEIIKFLKENNYI